MLGGARTRVERLETARSVEDDAEVTGERRRKCGGALVWVDLRTK